MPMQNDAQLRSARTVYILYLTVYLVISPPNLPYIHRIYIYMVLANPMHNVRACGIDCGALNRGLILLHHGSDIDSHRAGGKLGNRHDRHRSRCTWTGCERLAPRLSAPGQGLCLRCAARCPSLQRCS